MTRYTSKNEKRDEVLDHVHQDQTLRRLALVPVRPKLQRTIVPHSVGDWNVVRVDGVVLVYARYSIRLADGTLVGITNEGYGRASAATMKSVFEDEDPAATSMTNGGQEWYTRTLPKFEVGEDRAEYRWLTATVFLGVLKPPTRQGYVEIDVFEVL
ncbi:hypothetical protein BP00DRAFT_447982 [Aspergillus indologenus CBS 114.80]|uniref:DUF3237 domain protein n=1 Tax=Aspergillus indologenus CBS 114.80 TaxID=1450541 RepID=A0A2V5I6Q6_9EURO|nr:hypothetical protein BP00DRAFT_447982 [Aspergillus indologenus CBS 114.80]